ncbi:hypothetical protein [Sodalis sp. (in: enterobacteria)]
MVWQKCSGIRRSYLALKRGRRDDEYRTRLSALRAIRGRSVAHE